MSDSLFPIELKAISETGEIEGYASTFGNRDLVGDIVQPGAFTKSLKGRAATDVLMLWGHDHRRLIGVWTDIAEDSIGLRVKGRIMTETRDGAEAFAFARAGAARSLSHLLQGSQDAAHAAGQVKAALESMGDASGKTFEQLSASAEALRNLTGVDDDEILTKLTANMLSFGNIAGDAFDRAQLAALNLSARMQGDLQGATMMVGKALNDPVKGLAALGRAGIQFTEQQKEQIKGMVAVGNAAGAQAIMLNELERQFGGAAEAAGNADVWKPMKTALMDLEGAFEPIVRDVLGPLIAKVAEITRAFANLSPETQKFIAIGATVAAALGPLLVGLGGVVTAVGALLPVFGAVAAVMSGPVTLAVGAAVLAFLAFKDDIIPVVMQFATTLKEVLGPKIQPLFEALKGAVSAVGEMFGAIFGGGSGSSSENLKVWGQSIAQVFGAAIDLITGAINIITNVFRALGALLRGDFSAMWGFLWQAVKSAVSAILNAFETLFPGVIDSMRKLVEGVTSWLQGRLFGVLKSVIDKVKGVSDAFFKLYDAVVGHSYVPDMVTEIGQWMAKLDAGMVQPARNATRQAADAFRDLRADVARIMEGLLSDAERNAREVAEKIKKIRALAAQGGMTKAEADSAEAGVWGEGLEQPSIPQIDPTKPLIDPATMEAINSVGQQTQQVAGPMAEAMQNIGYAVGDLGQGLVDLALTGEGSLGDLLKSFIKTVAGIIAQMLLLKAIEMATGIPVSAFMSGGGGGGSRGGLGGFFSNLLGFKGGGSFEVGGSGTADSKLVAFRATPGERVDISTKGQQRASGGGAMAVHVVPSRYFDVQVQKVAAPLAVQAAAAGGEYGRQAAGKDRRNEYDRSRKVTV